MPSPTWRPRLAIVLALAFVMVTSMWGPIAPHAGASQFHDPGTDDPEDVEGVDEPPWRAWETTSIQGGWSHTDITTGPDDEPYITWGLGKAWLAYPAEDPRPGHQFETMAVNDNGSARGGGVAVQDDGRIWVAYQAQGIMNGHDELYAATTTDPGESEWTRWRLADVGALARVAIDDAGTVHVVYQDEDITLRHATYTPETGWEQENVTDVEPSGIRDVDLAVKAGRIHLVWGERAFENPTPIPNGYAVKAIGDTAWTTEEIPYEIAWCGFAPDVGAAPDGSAWISCVGENIVQAFHRDTDGAWSLEQASDLSTLIPPRQPTAVEGRTSIAVDEDGIVHLLFGTESPAVGSPDVTRPGQPQYVARVDGDWVLETIDRTGQDNGGRPSITVDSQGRPQGAYVLFSRFETVGPCPGCGLVNERYQIQHAQPVAATVDSALP